MKENICIGLAVVAIIISLYAVVKPSATVVPEVTKADFEAQKAQLVGHEEVLKQIVDFINKGIEAQQAPKK